MGRNVEVEEPDNSQYLTSFSSLSLLLLCLFVALNASRQLHPEDTGGGGDLAVVKPADDPQSRKPKQSELSQRLSEIALAFSSEFRFDSAPHGEATILSRQTESFFRRGSDQLEPDGQNLLTVMSNFLNNQRLAVDIEVIVENHEVPGPRKQAGWALCASRAMVLYRGLLGRGVDAAFVTSAGHVIAPNGASDSIASAEALRGSVRFLLKQRPVEEGQLP